MSELKDLKAGDRLFAKRERYAFGFDKRIPFSAYVVERLTNKQIVAKSASGNEVRFHIDDGRMIGGERRDTAFVPTQEQIAEQALGVKVANAQAKASKALDAMQRSGAQNDAFWLMLADAIGAYEKKGGAA